MDPAQVPAYLAIALNAIIILMMIASFMRGYAMKDDLKSVAAKVDQCATKEDIKELSERLDKVEIGQTQMLERMSALETRQTALENRLSAVEKKADASHELHNTVHIDLKVLQSSVNRLESYFETPQLRAN